MYNKIIYNVLVLIIYHILIHTFKKVKLYVITYIVIKQQWNNPNEGAKESDIILILLFWGLSVSENCKDFVVGFFNDFYYLYFFLFFC